MKNRYLHTHNDERIKKSTSTKHFFQPKLSINQPNDVYEHEADAMADKVMAVNDSHLHQQTFFSPSIMPVQRKCQHCEEEEKKLHRKEANSNETTADASTENYISSLNGKGRSLTPDERNFFEPRMGYDFSNIQLHTNSEANQSAKSINALAYTHSNHIVFGSNQYQPNSESGQRLMAHELTHVVQQKNQDNYLQRATTTGDTSSTKAYDINSEGVQDVSSRSTGFAKLQMAYDDASKNFTCTFPLTWIFPHGWDDTKRSGYVTDFEAVIKKIWEGVFWLQETKGAKRTANVVMAFDEKVIAQGADEMAEARELSSALSARSTWTMDVRNINVRANVSGTTVQLDENANKPQSRKGSALMNNASFVVHDGNENKTFTQTTSAHEFGHMIGLGDEYLDDSGTPVSQLSAGRAHINNRIMNVGENVTKDAYQPFADWISGLTKSQWVVGNRKR
jgi:hypothetical protein